MSTTPLNYIEEQVNFTHAPLKWQEQGLQQTASGYGKKLTTQWKMQRNGREYRVYCMCFSNSGTLYIISKGKRLIIRDYTVAAGS